jgi:hypothetical protein
MSSTPSQYPTAIDSYTTKVNHIDVYEDDDINKLQNSVIALQTYVGVNPQGSKSTLSARLAVMMATNGAFAQGTAFPTNPVDGQVFYRTDQDVIYVYNGSSWDSQGQSLSNFLFGWCGVFSTGAGLVVDTNTIAAQSFNRAGYAYLMGSNNSGYNTCYLSHFRKISGVSTANIFTKIWQSSGGAARAIVRVTIGTVSASGIGTESMQAPEAVNFSIDVSGLTNGTTYNVVAELQSSGGSFPILGQITGIAS